MVRSLRVILFLVLMALFVWGITSYVQPVRAIFDPTLRPNQYVSNEIVVRYEVRPQELEQHAELREDRGESFFGRVQNTAEEITLRLRGLPIPEQELEALSTLGSEYAITQTQFLSNNPTDPLADFAVLRARNAIDVPDAISEYDSLSSVATAEPNLIMYAQATADDPAYGSMWGLAKMQVPTAWDTTKGATSVKVAVLDTGIEAGHEDFAGRTIIGGAANADGNGHGTHVAGTIGAVTNNQLGVSGINWDVTLMPIKVLSNSGSGNASAIAQGIASAVSGGAKVMNMSLGGQGSCPSYYQTAINSAVSAGVTVVIAAGNDNTRVENFTPANCQNVIVVAATGPNDEKAAYSNYGSLITVAAPGGNSASSANCTAANCILSTWPGSLKYKAIQGTSMASPHVAGVVALLYARNPNLTFAQVKQIITSTADDVGPAGRDDQFGAGRVNAARAVAAVTDSTPGDDPPTATPTLPGPSHTPGGPTNTGVPATPTGFIADGCPVECVRAPGSTTPLRADGNANCDDVVDEEDFALWLAQRQRYQRGASIPKAERTADFMCDVANPSTQRVDMIDYEFWRKTSLVIVPTTTPIGPSITPGGPTLTPPQTTTMPCGNPNACVSEQTCPVANRQPYSCFRPFVCCGVAAAPTVTLVPTITITPGGPTLTPGEATATLAPSPSATPTITPQPTSSTVLCRPPNGCVPTGSCAIQNQVPEMCAIGSVCCSF